MDNHVHTFLYSLMIVFCASDLLVWGRYTQALSVLLPIRLLVALIGGSAALLNASGLPLRVVITEILIIRNTHWPRAGLEFPVSQIHHRENQGG